ISWARSAACGNSHMDGSSASSAAQQQQEECNKETASLVGLELLAALRAERSESAADVAAGADKRPTDLDLLLADGRLLSVHSTVMRVFSEFFRVMLSVEMRERREGRVDLSHLEARHVAYCIDLLYGDVQPLDKDSVLDVAYVANFLQLPVATRHCQRLLMRCFTTAELDSAYALFERLSWNEFMDELNRQVRLDSWEDANRVHKFSFDRLLSVLSRPELSVSGEDRVLDVCSRWMDDQRIGVGNGPATAAQRIRLLSCIRQLYLGPDCLTKFRTLAAACGFPGSLPAQPPLNTPFRRLELAAAGAAPADLLMPRCCQERMLFISGPDIQGACLSLFFVDPLELKQQGQQQQLTLHCEQLDAPEFKMRTVELQCCVGGGGCVLFLHETVMNVMYSFVSMPAPSSLYAIDLAGVLPVLRYQGVPDSLIGFRMLCLGSRLYAFGGRDCRMTIRDLVFVFDSVTPGGTMKWDHVFYPLESTGGRKVPVLLPQPMSELAVLAVPSAALPQSAPDSVNKAAKLDRAAAASRHVLLSGGRTNGDEEGDPRPALNCLYRYDSHRMEFSRLADMNRSRFGHSMHLVGNRIFVFGGTPDSSESPFSFAEYYSPDTDQWTVVSALESLGPSRPLTSILGGRIFYIGRPHGQEMLRDGLWEFELDNGYEGVTSLHHLRDLPVAMRDATRRETHCVALSVNVSPSGLRSLRQLLLSPSEDADARSSESGGGSRRASRAH
ncbi:hypothetical protein BOX15_Mlig004235g1, partial [Macrostomum lignano]